jgi:two-component system CheB/CheR fusion protein
MRALVQAIQDLSRVRTPVDVAAVVGVAARRLAGADGAAFILREGDQCHYLDEDAVAPLLKGQRFPVAVCISGWAMTHRQVVVIPDVYADPRAPIEAFRPTFVRSLVLVPVRSDDPIAAIGVYWAQHHHATPAEVELLQLLADSTATAMENVWLHANMQRQVEERTRELRAARELAEQANAAKSRFLAAASHNLRQPIQTLSAIAAILKRVAPGDVPAHVHAVEDAVHSMESLVDALLDLHRLEAGAIQPALQDASLEEVFARLRSEFAYAASAKALQLIIPRDAPSVHSDPNLLQEILRNFLSNAIKYTTQGEVRLACHTEGAALRIEVSDTGAGVPAPYLERIFDAFYRSPDATASKSCGVGLGLSIVQHLARILGCPIGVDSKVGAGSRFWIVVPPASGEIAAAPSTLRTPPMRARGAGRILYIEDDPAVRHSITFLLRIEGYEIRACSDGVEALRVVTQEGFDPTLIVADSELPAGETGEQAIERVRAALGREAPALVLTGRMRDGGAPMLAASHRVLYKPVDANALLDAIAATITA